LSIFTPGTCTEELGWSVEVGKMSGKEVLFFVLALVKCTRIPFYWAIVAPGLLAHSKHLL
jgi:hypothetical protein